MQGHLMRFRGQISAFQLLFTDPSQADEIRRAKTQDLDLVWP